MFPKITY